jgi:ribose 5-phosphate isomerase B
MNIVIGADHGGFELKNLIAEHLQNAGHAVQDVGAYTLVPTDDYPDFAAAVARVIQRGEAERGIVICGSGVGACIAANKFAGVRAGMCHDTYSAHQGVEHDNMNVLCLGARVIGAELAFDLVDAYLGARFSGAERHARRVAKIAALEKGRDV